MQTFSRRISLQAAAAATALGLLHEQAARANDAQKTIGLGFSLYGMKTLPTEKACQVLSELGYDCFELPVMREWPADSAQLSQEQRRAIRNQIGERSLRLTALMENLPAVGDEALQRQNLERLKLAVALAHDLAAKQPPPGQPAVPLIETILGGKAGQFEAVKGELVDRLGAWAKVLAEAQVTLAVKAHVSNATQRPEQLLWLLDQVASPWLKAACDYSHFELQGLALKETWDALAPKTVFIHVKDTEHSAGKRGFLLPGEGSTDYAEYFRLLAASEYRGDVVVEVSGQVFSQPDYRPIAAAEICYNHLAPAMQKGGIRRG
ncbi:MAG: sugar phosphate isomerase/epimerase [Pirellulaceae bacterium]